MATPHTRGSTLFGQAEEYDLEGYPAYAGIDPQTINCSPPRVWLPRIRGDRPLDADHPIEVDLATPHTRGSTRQSAAGKVLDSGYPAYAGIDLFTRPHHLHKPGLPRIRGDRPQNATDFWRDAVATPHTRGSTLLGCDQIGFASGYPAYAGIDLTR